MSDFYCDEALSGRTLVKVVVETDTVLAFEHTRPSYPVHIVVVPKLHMPSLVDLGDGAEELLLDVVRVVRQVAAQVRQEYGAACVVTNEGGTAAVPAALATDPVDSAHRRRTAVDVAPGRANARAAG